MKNCSQSIDFLNLQHLINNINICKGVKMSEQKSHVKIEDTINEILEGELRENALNFVAYLNADKLSPVPLPYEMDNGKTIGYKIPYNGHFLGWILINEDGNWCFQIFNYLDFGEGVHSEERDEKFKETVYAHVKICGSPCYDECWRAKDVKIFGKEFKSVCSQHSRDFVNPDSQTIAHIKKLIHYSKQTTPYQQQYHPHFL